MTKYVWFLGRCWIQENDRKDYLGRLHLVDIKDSSCGISALPERIVDCSEEETKALNSFKERLSNG